MSVIRQRGAWSVSNIFGHCKNCTGLTVFGVCQACGFTVVCCACKQVKQPDNSYRKQGIDPDNLLSHSFCPPCLEDYRTA